MSTLKAPRRTVVSGCLLAAGALVLGACGEGGETPEMGTIVTSAAPGPESAQQIPEVAPRADGPCPYLPAETAGELNGEPVTNVRLDEGLDPPACFFYGEDGAIQFTTTLYELDSEDTARQLVDASVPADIAEAVEFDGNWAGAQSLTPGSALLAVSDDDRVFVVHSRTDEPERLEPLAETALSEID